MLPELLFSVGSSMQDSSRDDFGLLNGVSTCDKDSISNLHTLHQHHPHHSNRQHQQQQQHQHQQQLMHNHLHQQHLHLSNSSHHPLITGTDCTLEPVKLGRTPDHESAAIHIANANSTANAAQVAIKLEEPDVHYHPWHTSVASVTDIGSNLLCHSDDPLISGAIDDNQNEFNPIHSSSASSHHPHNGRQLQHSHSLLLPSSAANDVSCSLIKAEETLIHHHAHLSDIAPQVSAFESQQPANSSTAPPTPTTAPSTPAPAPARKKPPRTRRKGQLKLRFHHQALPQEYLDHYEATQNSQQKRDTAKAAEQLAASKARNPTGSGTSNSRPHQQQAQQLQQQAVQRSQCSVRTPVLETITGSEDPQQAAARAHASVRNWLQKISEFQHDNAATMTSTMPVIKTEPDTVAALAPSMLTAVDASPHQRKAVPTVAPPPPARIVQYSDLPFMGEMTLDNSKPRRGRKPKKADICHLIYKNYGTILPGTPKDMLRDQPAASRPTGAPAIMPPLVHIDRPLHFDPSALPAIHSKQTANSLLEKRLLTSETTAQSSALSVFTIDQPMAATPAPMRKPPRFDEPLNLCLRDRSGEPYTVMSSDEEAEADDDNDDYDLMHDIHSSTVTSRALSTRPPTAASDTDSLLAANMRMSLPNFQSALLDTHGALLDTGCSSSSVITAPAQQQPPGLVYWPTGSTGTNASVLSSPPDMTSAPAFIHPMALYYQKIAHAANGGSGLAAADVHLPYVGQQSPAPSICQPAASGSQLHLFQHYPGEPTAKILIPKNISDLLRQHSQQQSSVSKRAEPCAPSPSTSSSTATASTTAPTPTTTTNTSTGTPHKRKRSAIFIPPMPVESATPGAHHHATEVSICKFKFTGGAKPSLQEKKMLSVDAGGNFRYYSGTGDKSMRGYEFFPRESLQQSQAAQAAGGSSAGAFLSAAGERISLDVLPPPSLGLSNEVLQLQPADLPSPTEHFMHATGTSVQAATSTSAFHGHQQMMMMSSAEAASAAIATTNPNSAEQRHKSSTTRKSRRSLQREKLEKTFKEKGFLIQTQQLESAEGATYCKFRQLRKFTRYLFRSWKDYLPGELQQATAAAAAAHAQAQADGASASSASLATDLSSSPASVVDATTRMMMNAAAAAAAAASDANTVGLQETMLAEHQKMTSHMDTTAAAEETGPGSH